ncbi:MAG: TetR/AcrR family transcriptional regulator [Myxococcales bacterium]|nr:TetR/AcrR family transcriptional regulator [Myxococcales bacterium]
MTDRPSSGKAEILAAAARAFAEHGYHGMSMRDLGKLTKRSPATLYNYVDGKEDLLYLIQRDAFEEMLLTAETALAGETDAEARLHAFVLGHVRFFADRQYLMRVLIHEAAALPPARRAEIRELKEKYFRVAEGVVADVARARNGAELSPLDVERNTYCLFGMLNWTYGWYEPQRHGTPEELAATIERVAAVGVAAGVSRPRRDREERSERAEAHGGAR